MLCCFRNQLAVFGSFMDENSKLTKFQLPVAQSRLDISLPLAIMWACDFETLVAQKARAAASCGKGELFRCSAFEVRYIESFSDALHLRFNIQRAVPSLCVRFKTISVALR